MQPPRDTRGRDTLDRARRTTDIDVQTRQGVMVVPAPAYGAWDVWGDDAIQQAADDNARQLQSSGLHRGSDSADTATDPARRSEPGGLAPHPGRTASDSRGDRVDHAHADGAAVRLTRAQRRARKLTQVALALRVQGWELRDIAAKLGVTTSTITGWFATHRRDVVAQDIDATLDQIAVPLATENLIHGLLAGDKDYTLETLKGRGALRRHGESDKAPTGALPELVIRFEAPVARGTQPTNDSLVAGGRVVGAMAIPRVIEGTVVDRQPITGSSDAASDIPIAQPAPPA